MRSMRRSAECRAVAPLIPEAVDAEADERVLRVVELHVTACESCRAELDQLRVALGLLETLEEVEATPDFETRLMARLRTQRVGRWSWADLRDRVLEGLAVRPLRTAALAGTLAVVSIAVLRGNPSRMQEDLTARMEAWWTDPVLDHSPTLVSTPAQRPADLPAAATMLATGTDAPADSSESDELEAAFDALEERLATRGAELPLIDTGPWPTYAPGDIVPAALGTEEDAGNPTTGRRSF